MSEREHSSHIYHESKAESFEHVLTAMEDAIQKSEDDPAVLEAFISERVKTLLSQSQSTHIGAMGKRIHPGFIHPETEIQRNGLVDPVYINDNEAYNVLFETLLDFKLNPGWKDKTLREMSVSAIQIALGRYFGNPVSYNDTDARNREFYMNHTTANSKPLSIGEFEGKGIAVCAEKAALAQNLLSFMGMESTMVVGELKESVEDMPITFHVYNICKTNKGHFVYDPTHPSLQLDSEEKLISTIPSVYPISAEQFEELMAGGSLSVTHRDFIQDQEGTWQQIHYELVYVGPKS